MSGISFRELDPHDRYKLLCGVVVPRPIALVTTLDENGGVNAAPFSFFNVFSEDPPLLVLGLQHKADFSPKDTTRNIHRSGQFVVHLVDEALAATMNDCAIDFPSGDSEVEATGRKKLPSIDIDVPRPGKRSARIFALPGVPSEMRDMWEQTVGPAIAQTFGAPRIIRHWHFGNAEAFQLYQRR